METLKSSGYDNIKMHAPDGVLLCYVSRKKASWYLDRNMASSIGVDAIQLQFDPNGRSDLGGYAATPKLNQCVVCGSQHDLTKHHCVPTRFRRHFPVEYKEKLFHDVLLVCLDCHKKYEKFECEIQPLVPMTVTKVVHCTARRAANSANALLRFAEHIPEPRLAELRATVESYAQTAITPEILEEVAAIGIGNIKPDYKGYVDSLDDLDEFVRRWRRDFISKMKPRFMPEGWSVDSPTTNDA